MESNKHTSGPYYNAPVSSSDPGIHPHKQESANGFDTAALILGILALLSFFSFTIIPPIILGALSIILAILSKGKKTTMHFSSKTGVTLSTIALVGNVLVFAFVYGFIFSHFEDIYGMSYGQMMEEMENGTLDTDKISKDVYRNLSEMLLGETASDTSDSNTDTLTDFEKLYRDLYEQR